MNLSWFGCLFFFLNLSVLTNLYSTEQIFMLQHKFISIYFVSITAVGINTSLDSNSSKFQSPRTSNIFFFFLCKYGNTWYDDNLPLHTHHYVSTERVSTMPDLANVYVCINTEVACKTDLFTCILQILRRALSKSRCLPALERPRNVLPCVLLFMFLLCFSKLKTKNKPCI